MADNIISSAPAIARADSSQLSYNAGANAADLYTSQGDRSPFHQVGAPLQLMPEIHGMPSKPSPGEGQTNHLPKSDQAVPMPKPRPHDVVKTPAQKVLADKTLHVIAAANSKDFGPPSLQAQAVIKQFLAEKANLADKDKPAVLKKMAPDFDHAIRTADNAFIQIQKEADPKIKGAQEKYIEVNSDYNQSFEDAKAAAKGVQSTDQAKAALLLAGVAVQGAELPDKDKLTKVFKNDPEFLNTLLQLGQDQKSLFAAANNLDAANKPVLDAAVEQDRTRLAYERAAQSVGDKPLAKSIDAERVLLAEQTFELTKTPEELRRVIKI
jgi:hypothetical protein